MHNEERIFLNLRVKHFSLVNIYLYLPEKKWHAIQILVHFLIHTHYSFKHLKKFWIPAHQ